MSYEDAHRAIRVRFETEWASLSPVQYPNVSFKEPNRSWARLNIEEAAAIWASFGDPGNNTERNFGQVTVQIFTESGTGEGESLFFQDKVKQIFRSWRDATSGVRFLVPPYARLVGAGDKWYQVNVVAPFQFDDFT